MVRASVFHTVPHSNSQTAFCDMVSAMLSSQYSTYIALRQTMDSNCAHIQVRVRHLARHCTCCSSRKGASQNNSIAPSENSRPVAEPYMSLSRNTMPIIDTGFSIANDMSTTGCIINHTIMGTITISAMPLASVTVCLSLMPHMCMAFCASRTPHQLLYAAQIYAACNRKHNAGLT